MNPSVEIKRYIGDYRRALDLVEYDKEQCASCYMCIMSCPYGILKYDSINQTEIMKCNMCVHRSEDGKGNPMCVEKCPMQAITVEEV